MCCREDGFDVLFEKQLDLEAVVNKELDSVASDMYLLVVGTDMRLFKNTEGQREASTEDLVGTLKFEQPSPHKAPDLFYVYVKTKNSKKLLCAINPYDDSLVIGQIIKTAILNNNIL